ncbi:MFS transporter [Helcobacillus massiliensis]|uniref:MFS transporter n=1 Tax=Helcobacillus massiliensis TaxID=521392 RepID=UPI0021A34043|nr:MFS transporter [Helcobacillus massiliensis]MCT1558212.1 MFS transporter [Helcobacillus massiliensis]MCT2036433.1 MFS transporter [Helcobacillus massiliensis]MCT2332237.1 MFS transporter [Helcobacillus massiliensis]MDK7741778.1 MFS transporter [Helcobacillus massiliensis]WOO92127.1 MFS transporter [Helcobacillus massiliensis]
MTPTHSVRPAGRGAGDGPRRERLPQEILVLVGAAFVIAIGFGLVSPVLPAYARTFDVGVAGASVIVSAFAAFRLLFAPAGGALAARLGERRIYLTGLTVVALSSLATAFAGSYVQLLVFRGLGGIGSTMFTVSAMSLLVRLAPPRMRGRVSSAYGSAFLIGGMVGPVLGGMLASYGLRTPFVVYAAALAAAVAVVAVGIRPEALRPKPGQPARAVMTPKEAVAHPTYRAALISGLANGWTNFGVRVAVVPQLAFSLRGDAWAAGAALAVSAVGTAAALQGAGRVVDRHGRRPVVITGLAVMGVGMAALALTEQLGIWFLLACCLVSGMGAGLVNPGQQAAVADVVGSDRSGSRVLAVFQMAQDLGAVVGPVLIGLVADAAGWGWAFALTGGLCGLALIPWLSAPETLDLSATGHAVSSRGGQR